ncbi:hypothetical protein [Dysgonomonas sp. BGC7]|uniref:hypothetical protein n=1 Tax=Dysgonomonas sp. BGC7 TaxID=1658008 RepID=UPI00067F96EE|nr:hypothetical protein [Dysgonomonas sp. BGC7]MBD8390122.1 hypothetical protein [Dysgonomonas sp. BGC7]
MSRKLYIIPFILITFIYLQCTPYNSDKVNHQLIQGKWMLVEADHNNKILDTVKVDYQNNQTILVFDDNNFTQYMPDLNDTINLRFLIKDYSLALLKDTIFVNTFSIKQLTQDSLILSQETNKRIYKKIK